MNFFGFTLPQLEAYFEGIGENKAKAKAMFRRVYKENASCAGELDFTDRLKERIMADIELPSLEIEERLERPEACKLLFLCCPLGKSRWICSGQERLTFTITTNGDIISRSTTTLRNG